MDNLLKNIYTSKGKFQVLFMMQLDQSTLHFCLRTDDYLEYLYLNAKSYYLIGEI